MQFNHWCVWLARTRTPMEYYYTLHTNIYRYFFVFFEQNWQETLIITTRTRTQDVVHTRSKT